MLWKELGAQIPAVRTQHATAEGRALRAARLPANRAAVEQGLPRSITGQRRAELVDLVVALASSSMLLELVDRMGHEPEAAARLVAAVIRLVVEQETDRTAGERRE